MLAYTYVCTCGDQGTTLGVISQDQSTFVFIFVLRQGLSLA